MPAILHANIADVTVCGLIGESELIVTIAPEGASGATAEVADGSFLHRLVPTDGEWHLSMCPQKFRLVPDGSANAYGVIKLSIPRGMTLYVVGCYGKWVWPDGEVHMMDGSEVAWIAP